MSLIKNINPSLVLVQPRKTRPLITERLLMGPKESTQTKQTLMSLLTWISVLSRWSSSMPLISCRIKASLYSARDIFSSHWPTSSAVHECTLYTEIINRGSYMSAHVLLNLLNELGKRDKMRGLQYLFFATSLINSIIQEHEC